MQARVRAVLVIGVASLAGAAIFLGFRSQPETRSMTAPEVNGMPAGEATTASGTGTAGGVPAADAAVTQETTAVHAPEAAPALDDTTATDAKALVRQARTHLAAGEPRTALPLVRHALQLQAKDAGAWNVLGRTELALRHPEEAEAAFLRACEIDSAQAYARNNLGWLYLQEGRWQEALPLLEAAVRLRADVAYFHNNLGLAYEHAGRWSEASAAYSNAVQLDPGHVNARLSLARVAGRVPAAAVAEVAADSTLAGRAVPNP